MASPTSSPQERAGLGFQLPDQAKTLGLSNTWWSPGSAQDAFKEFSDPLSYEKPRSNELTEMRMEWGRAHEANCYSLFFPPHQTIKQIHGFKSASIIRVEEATFQRLISIPSSIMAICIQGQPNQELAQLTFSSSLPPIGASPDGFLVLSVVGKERVPLEFKCPFPFSLDGGQSDTLTYQFTPFHSWTKVPAPYYAQCQINMMVNDSQRMLLVQYTTEKTTIFEVKRDDGWLAYMLLLLRASHSQKKPVPEVVSSSNALMKIYEMLLEQTLRGIQSKVRELGKVDSVNGPDSARFKN